MEDAPMFEILMERKSKFILSLILLFSVSSSLFAQKTVDFYATVTSSSDTNTIKMTTDLYFTQFQGLDGYLVSDKRDTAFGDVVNPGCDIAFYAEIQESDGGWSCTLNAIGSKGQHISETRTYASYYKILLDAKSSLENLLNNVASGVSSTTDSVQAESNEPYTEATLETLAGTWTGEALVDKVIILRGGNGFVIFKNGASMNVAVTIKGSNVTVVQKGRSNASFHPEINRELALKTATDAAPIKWTLTTMSAVSMKGTKSTLVEDSESSSGVKTATLDVEWTKQQ